ncbi:MAG: hypothetical protein IT560_04845 [Alphaproteobacteria bacterium]|nr:hypothetical protein [Alphaproteobacteria bacterium]
MPAQANPEWWRIESVQGVFNQAADNATLAEAKQLYRESAKLLGELATLVQGGSYGMQDGSPATFQQAQLRVVAPADKVGRLSRGDHPELGEGFEALRKQLRDQGEPMWKAIQHVHDEVWAANVRLDARKAPPTAKFKRA